MPVKLSREQKQILRQALGLTKPGKAVTRNYCCPEADDSALEQLVELGVMRRGSKHNNARDQYYHVTQAGAAAIKTALPKGQDTDMKTKSPQSFQDRVDAWMFRCFGHAIAKDLTERNHRFLEEALEL